MLQSETYEVIDGEFFHNGLTETGGFYYNIFSSSDVSHSTDGTGTIVQNHTSSLKTLRVKYANSTELQFTDKSKIEFDCLGVTGNVSLQMWKSNTSGNYIGVDIDQLMSNLTNAHISIEVNGTKLIIKVDNTEKTNTNFSFISDGKMSIRFLLEDSCTFKYKNFVVYPI